MEEVQRPIPHTELAAILAGHLERLQSYLEDWQLRQARLLEAAASGAAAPGELQPEARLLEADASEAAAPSDMQLKEPSRACSESALPDARPAVFVPHAPRPPQGQAPPQMHVDAIWTSGQGPQLPQIAPPARQALPVHGSPLSASTTVVGEALDAKLAEEEAEMEKESTDSSAAVQGALALGIAKVVGKAKSLEDEAIEAIEHEMDEVWDIVEKTRFVQFMEYAESSELFHGLCSLMIIVNAAFLAIQAEHAVTTLDPSVTTPFLFAGEIFFTCFYSVEITMRFMARGPRFFFDTGCSWNWFDVFLIVTALHDHFSTLSGEDDSSSSNISFLRIIRLMKLAKLMRIVRLWRAFHELRMVMDSMMGSMKSMIWSILLILSITLIFSLVFLEGATQFLLSDEGQSDLVARAAMLDAWGSLGSAMLSLFKASTGGADWGDIAEPLWGAGMHFYMAFCFYVAFFLLVVMNSITSIFVDGVREYAEKDHNQIVQDQLNRKKEYVEKVRELFSKMDTDGSGDVSFHKFLRHMRDPVMQAFASSLEIEVVDLKQFFRILSCNGKTLVDINTFVVGCIKLRGPAKSMDMVDVLVSLRRFADQQTTRTGHTEVRLQEMHKSLLRLEASAPQTSAAPARRPCRENGASDALLEKRSNMEI